VEVGIIRNGWYAAKVAKVSEAALSTLKVSEAALSTLNISFINIITFCLTTVEAADLLF
jgi:hypothetical protein